MKDKKILILIVFATALTFVILFVTRPTKGGRAVSIRAPSAALETNASKLENQIQQARDLIDALVRLNFSLQNNLNEQKASFKQERNEKIYFQQNLKDAVLQIEALNKELNRAKTDLELTEPIRQKLDQINTALANLWIKPQQEKELKQQLGALEMDLNSIDRLIPTLLRENKSYEQEAQTSSELLKKKEDEAVSLVAKLKDEQTRNQVLSKNFDILSKDLKAAKELRSLLEKRSLDLKKKVETLRQGNLSLNEQVNALEKDLRDLQNRLSRVTREKELALKQIDQARITVQNAQKLQEELNKFQSQFEQLNREYANLKEEHKGTQTTLTQNETELAKRAEKILNLQERVSEMEARLGELQLKSNELQKEGALLREQNVAVQLERETLRDQLDQAKLHLNDLENQLAQISSILKPSPKSTEVQPQRQWEGAKKVDVELIPQTQVEAKDE